MEFYNVRKLTLATGDVVEHKNFKDVDGVEYEDRELVGHLRADGTRGRTHMVLKTPDYQNV